MDNFKLTDLINNDMPGVFVKIDSHDTDDWEHPDRCWLEYTPDGDTSEGQYIDIGRLT